MEALAGLASVVQLVEATAKAVKAISTLCRNICDTPSELEDLINHLSRIHRLLQQINLFETNSKAQLSSTGPSSLSELLNSINATLFKLQKRYAKYEGRAGIGRRLKLALLESTAIKKYSHRMQTLETELILQLQCKFQLQCSQKLEELISQTSVQPVIGGHSKPLWNHWNAAHSVRNVDDVVRRTCSWSYFMGKYSRALRLQVTVVRTESVKENDFSVHTRFELPVLELALQLQCRVAFRSRCSIILYGILGLPRIIPDESEYLEACSRGDLSSVRDMFRRGIARPEDISKANMTPLLYAAESGNAELVKFLLENGARANWTAGRRQTSPLQWAIQHNHPDVVRILIENDADLEYVSTIGWSAIFYCWPQMQSTGKEQSEVLKILAEHSVLDFYRMDILEWTAFQRASAFGTSKDIETLLTLGAKPLECTSPLQWTAIHYAVDTGNWSTFSALLPCYGDIIKDIVDERGWSLLHLAASRGHGQIVRHLLWIGANPHLESIPARLYLPETLFDRRCTPEDVAEAFGQEQHAVLLSTAQELGIELDRDVYWNANESVNSDNWA